MPWETSDIADDHASSERRLISGYSYQRTNLQSTELVLKCITISIHRQWADDCPVNYPCVRMQVMAVMLHRCNETSRSSSLDGIESGLPAMSTSCKDASVG